MSGRHIRCPGTGREGPRPGRARALNRDAESQRARRAAVRAALAALWLAAVPIAAAQAPRIQVEIDAGQLTLRAQDAPLAEVLRAIGERAAIPVTIRGDLQQTVSRRFTGMPLERALRELGRDIVLVMVHGDGPAPSGIVEIRAYGRSAGAPPLPRLSPIAAVRPGPPAEVRARGQALLRELRRTPGSEARQAAARVLASHRDRDAAAAALGELLAGDADRAVRAAALEALREMGGEDSVAALEQGLGDDDREIRAGIVAALGAVQGERSLMGLGQVLFSDPDPGVRALVVELLAGHDGGAAPELLQAATRDAHPLVRGAARRALGLE